MVSNTYFKKYLILASIAILAFAVGIYTLGKKSGIIVLLNGTSSSGKTSIIRALQKIHGDSFEYIVGDEWLETYNPDNPVPESAPRNVQQRQIFSDMFAYAKKLSGEGKNVFLDVVEFDVHYDYYCSLLDCNKVVKILVYCPLDILAKHVEKRNRLKDKKEHRPLNLSFGQFQDIYKLQENPAEMIVDVIKTSRIKKALQLAEQEVRGLMEKSGIDKKDFEKNISLFSEPFREQFKLDSLEEIVLVPQHRWDLITAWLYKFHGYSSLRFFWFSRVNGSCSLNFFQLKVRSVSQVFHHISPRWASSGRLCPSEAATLSSA